jgi:hypothetical protein
MDEPREPFRNTNKLQEPDGFHCIRHYRFLARGECSRSLARARDLLERLAGQETEDGAEPAADGKPEAGASSNPFAACPDCGGLMRCIGRAPAARAFHCDTS